MARTATPLNIESQPGIGMGYVVRNIKTRKLVRVSTTCARDLDNKTVKVLRAFSGKNPFFTAKIGSLHTKVEVLKFLCGPDLKKCRDTTDTYEWTGISVKEARKQKLEFSEPGYVVAEETVAKPKKAKKAKAAKVEKKTKGRRGRPKGSKNKVTAPVVADEAPITPAVVEPMIVPVAAVVTEEPTAPATPIQTDAEFEAEINKEFEKDLARTAPAVTA